MSFSRKNIEIAVRLAPDAKTNQPVKFAESGQDTVTLKGSRTTVRIQNSGAPAGSSSQIDVYGMTPSLMNQLSTLGMVFNLVPRNTLSISVGDETTGMSVIFDGTITSAYGEYNSAPNVPFHFECQAGLADAIVPAEAASFTGPTDVATIMEGLAKKMGLGFENNGVGTKLSNPYLSGTLWTQMRTAADHAGINADVSDGVLAIWPRGGSRNTQSIPLVSKRTGMVGYPAYTQQGIIVKTAFNPQIKFGKKIKVESMLKLANEIWAVNKIDLALDSQVPLGEWMAILYAYNPNQPTPIPSRA